MSHPNVDMVYGDTLGLMIRAVLLRPPLRFRLTVQSGCTPTTTFQGCIRSGANLSMTRGRTECGIRPSHGCHLFIPLCEAREDQHVRRMWSCIGFIRNRKIVACGIGLWPRTSASVRGIGARQPFHVRLKRRLAMRARMVWAWSGVATAPKNVSISSPPPASNKPSGEAAAPKVLALKSDWKCFGNLDPLPKLFTSVLSKVQHYGQSNRGVEVRILLSAYACEPGKDPSLGWAGTGARNRPPGSRVTYSHGAIIKTPIEAALKQHQSRILDFIYYDLPHGRDVEARRRGIRVYYVLWQWGAYRYRQALRRSAGVSSGAPHHFGGNPSAVVYGFLGVRCIRSGGRR